jgi:signal transduction histidine kinase
MQQFVGTSLKTVLYLLILAAFMPVTLLIFYIAEEQKDDETKAILQRTIILADAAANEENLQIESTQNLLLTLSDTYLMVGDRVDQLSRLLNNFLAQSKGYQELGIVDSSGSVIADSDPTKIGQDDGIKSWFSTLKHTKEIHMAPYQGEYINAKPVIYFSLPTIDNHRKFVGAVFAAVNLDWMNQTIFKQMAKLPKGSRLTLIDKSQGMLRYEANSAKWSIPENYDPKLQQKIIQHRAGILSARDDKGIKRIYAFTPLASLFRKNTIYIVFEIPEARVLGTTQRIFIRNLSLLILSALMAILIIWWAGDHFILRRIQKMVRAGRELASGNLSARIGKIGLRDELSHLAGVFDEMAASLQLRIEKEEKATKSLKQSRQQFRNLAAYQQEVLEQERIRIAREIHDQLGQSLTILKMDLSWLKKQLPANMVKVDAKILEMSSVIDAALKNLHAVMAELRPVILDDFGLTAAISWQIEEFQNHSGIECYFENNGFEPDLPKNQSTALFRIFQETLTNIMRHADAGKVAVYLKKSDNDLLLEIKDNGRGITEAQINDSKSYGLLGIRERLYPFKGYVSFKGKPAEGTCVTVRLPMASKGDPA